MKTASTILCCAALFSSLSAQRQTTLPGTEQFSVTSKVSGLEYRIDVSLPPKYTTATAERYPAIYLLDGNLEFAMAVQTHRMMNIDGLVPDMIIVGIGYQEDDPAVYTPAYAADRTRDYTPTSVADDPGGGQAAAFLSFLRNQLIPTIDRRYRTDPADRGLGRAFTRGALHHLHPASRTGPLSPVLARKPIALVGSAGRLQLARHSPGAANGHPSLPQRRRV